MDPALTPDRILDDLLVQRACAGRREAFEALAARWQERLWRHAFRLTGREDVAWDVLQESWMAIWRGLGRLREPGAFRRWAFTIVTRAAAERRRSAPLEEGRRATEAAELAAPAAEVDDPRADAIAHLRAALGLLPRERRVLLSLFHLEGFEIWELALILGVPQGTVKSRLHHARRQLKDVLERTQR
jgi:RNA polymerase sigma-70 factor (ECF subfamily)